LDCEREGRAIAIPRRKVAAYLYNIIGRKWFYSLRCDKLMSSPRIGRLQKFEVTKSQTKIQNDKLG